MEHTKATDFEVNDFQEDVIETSYETPVLVDFWAPWCGPCRVLSPTLEKLAQEQEGRWTLVTVNSDEHPALSRQYGIRGIPAVKLFVDGEVVDDFTGALPEHAVRSWLDEALPTENQKRLQQAEQALADGHPDQAEALLRDVLEEAPNTPTAKALLAQIVVFRDPEEAADLVAGASASDPSLLQTEEAIQTVARLHHLHDHPEDLPDEEGKTPYQQAIDALAEQDLDTALQRFIEVIQRNRYYDDDGARKAGVALFTLLGEQHPLTRKHRRTFDMWLY